MRIREIRTRMDRNWIPSERVLRARKSMNDAVRRIFDAGGFLEVETPIAVISPGLEPHLLAFETTEVGPDRRAERLYLHTSPEYAMKRMLGRGLGNIYQLARVFRNGERSSTHAPEFTMLEWYRSPGSLKDLVGDVEALISAVVNAVGGPWRPRCIEQTSVSEAFVDAGLCDPLPIEDLDELRRKLEVRDVAGDSWEDVFFRAFLDRVEPRFPEDAVTILHGYPAKMAALAKIDPKNPQRAERFEVYAGPLEIANAFLELADPVEQRARFETDLRVRARAGAPLYPIDEGLLVDLPHMGEAAGIALGVDRLMMRCLGLHEIQDVIPFSPRDRRVQISRCSRET